MTMIISGSDGVTFPDSTNQFSGGAFSFKNRIINGDMRIDQRNAGAAVTASGSFPVDRFSVFNSTDGSFSAQQDSSAPVGFVNSLKYTATTADGTLTTTQNTTVRQFIEGTNVSDLAWGTANAKTVTLSFWVRSSLTGTFGGAFRNSAADRNYPFTYSISVADTWEYKSVTVAGDTSGTWLTTTGIGVGISFSMGAGPDRSGTAGAWAAGNIVSATGATSVIGTLNANWYITGVQLEVGSVATPFERRPYGTELALCQRYFEKNFPADVAPQNGYTTGGFAGGGNGWVSFSTTSIRGPIFGFRVSKRAAPTMAYFNGNSPTSGTLGIYDSGAGAWRATTVSTSFSTTEEWRTDSTTSGWTPTTGNAYLFSGWWTASSEL
jgi:hypothetical protein